MIVKSGSADRFLARPPAELVAALVFGPDQGLVRERAEALMRSVVPDLADPFRLAEFSADALQSDTSRLWDEAAAFSMLGGRRVVRVRGAGNALAGTFQRFLADPPGEALVVLEAGDLNKGSSLRRLFETADNAAAIACYADNEGSLKKLIGAVLAAEGLGIAPQALEDAASRLGSDRGVTRRELEKLALYARGEEVVTQDHVRAVMGDESELRMEEVCYAAGDGDLVRLDRTLGRLWEAGASPPAILRSAMGHFQRLLLVRSEADAGGDPEPAMKKLRPPLHFKRSDAFRSQVLRWSALRLRQSLTLLYEAEILVKTTAVPGEPVCGRTLLSVAALARLPR